VLMVPMGNLGTIATSAFLIVLLRSRAR
jgi:hypothetical protein